jgi:hypothetical protein
MFSLEILYFWHALCYMLGSFRIGEKIISRIITIKIVQELWERLLELT